MRIEVTAEPLANIATDGLIVGLFEGEQPAGGAADLDTSLGGAIAALVASGDSKGKANEVVILAGSGAAKRVAIVGLGKRDRLTAERVRDAAAEACRALRGRGATSIASVALGGRVLIPQTAATATVEGAILGLYRFRRYFSKNDGADVESFTLVAQEGQDLDAAADRGRVLAEATTFARDLQNEPANILTPTALAARAAEAARAQGLAVEVYDAGWMREQGMGALLGVAQGSPEPPKFVVIRYQGDDRPPIGLVGKGITFDTGGISIKPAEGMELMKTDMSGAAAVIGAMIAIAQLKPARSVIGFVPTTENAVGGGAQRPGDIVKAFNGTTIEVINTDAEGRLILADALGYAVSLGCTPIVDLATLTGAMTIALGRVRTGVFTNDQPTLNALLAASERSGERMWPMPLDDEYTDQIRSDVADLKNTGGRGGGACTAAALLKAMVADTPWLHLDIAGTARGEAAKGHTPKGGTGVGVRTLVEFVEGLSETTA